ncbi:hypothetical protein AV521_45400 [Streptomyces sp. IMTB 2501]|uniref:hypothetical protein n=1 Tax=Streptomyces sp. IMTB 2501 TaxID=1776340 RepID=UPI00096C6B6F|nr:hypothetical protein [Streptomyces sp. IMTB 2501]OLZ59431.1 hypothetical protein AV521_45400 [Streptomyces sp. IMTB 2501]
MADLDLPYPLHALPLKVGHPVLADIPLDWVTGRALVATGPGPGPGPGPGQAQGQDRITCS